MFKTLLQDREIIESKYKPKNDDTSSLKYCFDENTGFDNEKIDTELAKLSAELKAEPHSIQKARLTEYVLENTRIGIDEHDYFIGFCTTSNIAEKYTSKQWAKEAYEEIPDAISVFNLYQETQIACGAGLDFYHTVPDWDSILSLGFVGLLNRANQRYTELKSASSLTEKQENYYKATEIELKAIIRFIDRLYKYAGRMNFEKAPAIANCLKQLRDGAPTNTYEALQLMYIYFMISEHVNSYQVRSLGYGIDGSLYPFFKKDLESGTYTKDEIAEFLGYFMLQYSALGNYFGQPMYLGGMNVDRTTKVNELSCLILDTYDKLGLYNPKIQIKINNTTPKDFVCMALEMIRHGNNSIVFCNDDMITKSLMLQRNATYERAVNSIISGCYEYRTKESVGISIFRFCPLKLISFVFDNGFDTVSGKQVGIKTGKLSEFKSFEDFYNAFLKQLEYATITYLDALNIMETKIDRINPAMLYSSTMDACMKTMTDALDGGVENTTDLLISGIGTVADALMAVHDLVYEKKLITLEELKQALDADWNGFEMIRKEALNNCRKYGNNDPMTDNYAAAIVQFIANLVGNRKNPHGGSVTIELHSALAFIRSGLKTKATPDGRKFGDETSKNASPTPGADTKGITALINSATSINTNACDSGFNLDAMLHPSAVQGEGGIEILYGLLKTYLGKGGISIQFNIFNGELLRDAQKNPEKYKNLQVRVCGWNVLWNNLSQSEQNAYILRAESIR